MLTRVGPIFAKSGLLFFRSIIFVSRTSVRNVKLVGQRMCIGRGIGQGSFKHLAMLPAKSVCTGPGFPCVKGINSREIRSVVCHRVVRKRS